MRAKTIMFLIILLISLLIALLYIAPMASLASGINHLLWQLWLFLKAFDQRLLWFLLSISLFALCCLRISRVITGSMSLARQPQRHMTTHSLQNWTSVFRDALQKRDLYARWNLAENLFSLYAQFYSYRYGINQFQFKRLLNNGDSNLPDRIARYLKEGSKPFTSVEKGTPFSIRRQSHPLDLNPEQVITYLEELYRDDS